MTAAKPNKKSAIEPTKVNRKVPCVPFTVSPLHKKALLKLLHCHHSGIALTYAELSLGIKVGEKTKAWQSGAWKDLKTKGFIVMGSEKKSIMGSAKSTFELSEWFGRQARYRLPAEMVRDNVLSVSDLLVHTVGGSSIKPSQPAGYYRHLNFPKRVYSPHLDQRQYQRGVYVHWQRQFLHPMLKALDAPSREECTAQRARSNTPLEALVMLNDPAMIDAAVAFASALLKVQEEDSEAKIARAFELTVSREPEPRPGGT